MIFLFQGPPPDIVNSPPTASDKQTNEVFHVKNDATEEINRDAHVEILAKDLNKLKMHLKNWNARNTNKLKASRPNRGVAVKNWQAASGNAHLEKPFALIP